MRLLLCTGAEQFRLYALPDATNWRDSETWTKIRWVEVQRVNQWATAAR